VPNRQSGALATVDVATGEPAVAINQRSDVCAVPAAAVVAEAMVALVVADAVIEKFGGDAATETARNARSYIQGLGSTFRPWSDAGTAAEGAAGQAISSPSGSADPLQDAPPQGSSAASDVPSPPGSPASDAVPSPSDHGR
jgi:hypothetical protein